MGIYMFEESTEKSVWCINGDHEDCPKHYKTQLKPCMCDCHREEEEQ